MFLEFSTPAAGKGDKGVKKLMTKKQKSTLIFFKFLSSLCSNLNLSEFKNASGLANLLQRRNGFNVQKRFLLALLL